MIAETSSIINQDIGHIKCRSFLNPKVGYNIKIHKDDDTIISSGVTDSDPILNNIAMPI